MCVNDLNLLVNMRQEHRLSPLSPLSHTLWSYIMGVVVSTLPENTETRTAVSLIAGYLTRPSGQYSRGCDFSHRVKTRLLEGESAHSR